MMNHPEPSNGREKREVYRDKGEKDRERTWEVEREIEREKVRGIKRERESERYKEREKVRGIKRETETEKMRCTLSSWNRRLVDTTRSGSWVIYFI